MDPAKKKMPPVAKIILALGMIMLMITAAIVTARIRFIRASDHAVAHVVGYRTAAPQPGDLDNVPTAGLVYAFTDRTGVEHRVTSSVSTSFERLHVGDAIAVDYLADDPSGAVPVRWLDRWLVAAIMGSIGAIFTFIGLMTKWLIGRPGMEVYSDRRGFFVGRTKGSPPSGPDW